MAWHRLQVCQRSSPVVQSLRMHIIPMAPFSTTTDEPRCLQVRDQFPNLPGHSSLRIRSVDPHRNFIMRVWLEHSRKSCSWQNSAADLVPAKPRPGNPCTRQSVRVRVRRKENLASGRSTRSETGRWQTAVIVPQSSPRASLPAANLPVRARLTSPLRTDRKLLAVFSGILRCRVVAACSPLTLELRDLRPLLIVEDLFDLRVPLRSDSSSNCSFSLAICSLYFAWIS